MTKRKIPAGWEPVIGLEIHAELNTKTKLFSWAPNRFGDEPNSNITPVCTGQPGALPVLNRAAVEKAVQFGLAVGAEINLHSLFDRKSYFYPDNPKNFQITQFISPIILGGEVKTEIEGEERSFAIEHAHLEEDAGMLKHFSHFAGVDYNRAGVPLVEIVSKPCMHSPEEASTYARALRSILQYLDISDCNMEEGSLRIDVNISVRKLGEKELRPKAEIKNINSFNFVELSLEAEIARQVREYEAHPDLSYDQVIPSSTYRWDPAAKKNRLMRKKEQAADYRYCPEPDIPPLVLEKDWVESLREGLPELPFNRLKRYETVLKLSSEQASVLVMDKKIADYFEEALQKCPHPRKLANWITVEFAGRTKALGKKLPELNIAPKEIALLVQLIEKGEITGKIAKSIADDLVANPTQGVQQIIDANPHYQPLQATGELESLIDQVLKEHDQSVQDFILGKERAFGFLVGQVMKLSKGAAPPQKVNEILRKKLGR